MIKVGKEVEPIFPPNTPNGRLMNLFCFTSNTLINVYKATWFIFNVVFSFDL